MRYVHKLYRIIAFSLLLVSASAQTGITATSHYEKAALTFDYPEGWGYLENSLSGVQTVVLTRSGKPGQIIVSVRDRAQQQDIPPVRVGVTAPTDRPKWKALDPCDFESHRKIIANELIEQVAYQINSRTPATTSPVTTELGAYKIEGARLTGMINRKPAAGESYVTRLNGRFVGVAYLSVDDDKEAKVAWDTIRATLKVEPNVMIIGTLDAGDRQPVKSGVLNGKAVALPPPEYPRIARTAHASGTVTVQLTIDENGDVIAAHAVSGHPLLQAASVRAARQAKFSQTRLCGEPVRVTGVMTYHFVAR